YSAVVNGYDVTNTHTPGKTSVSVTKTWNDSNNQDGKRPNSVTVHLYADDVDTGKTITLSDANHWSDSFTDLDEKKNGQKINYTVKEDEVTGYTSVTSGDAPTGYTVTNTHTPETVAVSGSKTWDDNNDQDGARPESITIRLLANGEEVQSKEVTASDNWSWTFSDLPKYKDGAEIAYSVKEDAVADYSASYEGANVTNTHTPGKTSISVSKAWEDSNNQDGKRPDKVVIHLLADGTDTGRTLELMADNQWTGSFTDLDEYASGKKIVYTVSEDGVNDYEATISGDAAAGYTVTNTHTPETVAVSGSKTWDDNNNQDGARPEKITIRLLADGTEVTSKEVTTADSWKWSFDNLAKYDNGKEIVYTITEDAVEDYTSKVNGYDVTNTHIPGKTSLYVTKAWEDSNNQDGKRPDSVAIHLLADGEDTGKTVTLNEANGWTASFEGLDAKKAGKDIAYTVKEDAAAGYDVTITGDAKTGYTVTNTYTPQTTSVSGAKTWEDNNNQDGIRPASIMIRLLADGKEVQRKEVTASDNWSWTFSDLPKYKDGAEITYSVKEDAVANYSTGYEGANVTNTYTPGKTSVSVSKTWNDNGNQDGKRPDKVVIHLLADGTDTGRTLELTENNRWTGSFTDLDEYANGQKITYTVSEEPVENYSTAISGTAMTGYTITNTITGKVSIPVTKVWSGGTGDKAVVHLFADGREIAKQELNPSNNWQHTFENLDKFKDGKEISYTLTEDGVSGYSTSITYSQEKGFTVTNAKTPDKPHEGGEGGPGSVSLYKVDAQTGEYLAGAEFALYRSDGVYIGTYTTDSHGYLNVQNLPYSSYYFKETKAPENYVANPGYIRFVLDAAHSAGNAYPWNIKVTNTKPGVPIVVIGGTKTWDDNNNAKGIRPETITLHLLANGIEIANTQTSAEQNWNYNFGTQPLYDAAGKAISYTVTEDAVAGYIFSLDDPVAGNGNIVINVKNTLAPEKPADNNKSEKLTGSNPKTERPTVTRNAATGDDSNMMLYLILMIGGITALVAYLIFMKKRQRKTE
ncbi:Cna protein B-type domain-containing protein, partial [Lachnospiraceae bacterium NK3A20]